MLVGIVIVILIPLFSYIALELNNSFRLNQAEDVVTTLAKTADVVYAMGPGAEKIVKLTMPSGVENITFSENDIILKLQIFGGLSEIISTSKARLVGEIPYKKGTQWVSVKAIESGFVQIGEYNDTTPPSVIETNPNGKIIGVEGTNIVTLEAYTDESAKCKYCQKPNCNKNTTYEEMDFIFEGEAFYHESEINLPGLGQYLFYVRCQDTIGNVMEDSAIINFTIVEAYGGEGIETENVPPEVYLIAPSNNEILNYTRVIFEYRINESAEIILCKLIINGEIASTNTQIVKNQTQNFTMNLEKGNYTWQVNCTDSFGNEGNSTVWNITINATLDTDLPIVNLERPTNNSWRNYNLVRFDYNVSDATSEISYCSLVISGELDGGGDINQIITDTSVNENETQTLIVTLQKGNYTWNINCTDSSSNANTGSSAKWFLRVNSTQEESFITSCAGWCGYNGFSGGVCENTISKCQNTCGLPYSSTNNCYAGDDASSQYCLGGPESDTCCCIP